MKENVKIYERFKTEKIYGRIERTDGSTVGKSKG